MAGFSCSNVMKEVAQGTPLPTERFSFRLGGRE